MMVAFCDLKVCRKRIDPKDHLKIDVMNERRDVHRGECYNAAYAEKVAIEAVARAQVVTLETTLSQRNSIFVKVRDDIGIPQEATW